MSWPVGGSGLPGADLDDDTSQVREAPEVGCTQRTDDQVAGVVEREPAAPLTLVDGPSITDQGSAHPGRDGQRPTVDLHGGAATRCQPPRGDRSFTICAEDAGQGLHPLRVVGRAAMG